MIALIRACLCAHIIGTAIQVSIVVGTVLNLINQGEAILHGGPVSWGRLLLNYLVPYLVASYSAGRNELRRRSGNDSC
ncbi:MAG: nitrate/nitrite transporter NrtS [Leptospirillia bacterium]